MYDYGTEVVFIRSGLCIRSAVWTEDYIITFTDEQSSSQTRVDESTLVAVVDAIVGATGRTQKVFVPNSDTQVTVETRHTGHGIQAHLVMLNRRIEVLLSWQDVLDLQEYAAWVLS